MPLEPPPTRPPPARAPSRAVGALRAPARGALPRPNPSALPPPLSPTPPLRRYPLSHRPLRPPPHLILVLTTNPNLVPGTKIQTYCTRFGYLGLVVTRRPSHERTSTTSGPRLGLRGPEGASAAAAPGRPLSEPYGGDRGGRRPRHPPLGGGRRSSRGNRGISRWPRLTWTPAGGSGAGARSSFASWVGSRRWPQEDLAPSPAARALPPARSGKGHGSLQGGGTGEGGRGKGDTQPGSGGGRTAIRGGPRRDRLRGVGDGPERPLCPPGKTSNLAC